MQNNIKGPAAESEKPSAAATAQAAPISQALRDMPEVDNQRVAELKAAIRQGDLDLAPESLAQTMMDYYRR